MKNLLNKSLSQFLFCTILLLFLTAPVFYLLTKYFYAEDLIDVIDNIRKGMPIPPLDLKSDIIGGIMIQYVLIFLVLSLAFILTMRLITKHLWKPFYDTLQKIERFNLEQNKIPVLASTNIHEFTQLNKAVSRLMHKDMESYNSQKEFIENASHELQTPTAVFQSKLDLLLQENLTAGQTKIVSDLYTVANRQNRLHKNLLLLAKIENRQYEQMEKIELIPFIEKNLTVYEELYNNHSLHFTGNKKPLSVKANSSLLESLFNNLMVNAIRNSPEDGIINISVNGKRLVISNDSDGKELDSKQLFRRFQNNTGKSKGNGLGLAIVKAICDYHGWKITYIFRDNRHCFSVIFC